MKKTKNTVLLLLVLFLAAGLGILVWKVQRDTDREIVEGAGSSLHADHSSEYIEHNGENYPVKRRISTVLLIGTDNYADTSDDVKQHGNYNYQFADFLAVLVFDHDAKTVTPLQINRDTVCRVPWLLSDGKMGGYGIMQINFAHTFGQGKEDSCENTVQAARWLLCNAPIDRYMAFTMDAVPVLNDLVGGVAVTLEDDIPSLGKEFVEGATVTLKGNKALQFVRQRDTSVLASNATRMSHQRLYLAGFTEAARAAAAKNQNLAVDAFKDIDRFLCTNLTVNNISEIVEDLCEYTILPVITPDGTYTRNDRFVEGLYHAEFTVDDASLWQCVYDAFCKKA
ncbi:MAG: LCP family protein [Oscillospiraceae bacterium]|nr:LCP family protein [Oscillospiraceae bacterium]